MTLPSISRLGSIAMFALAGRRSPINTMLVQRMLSGVVVVVGFAVAASMIATLLLVIGLYAGFLGLISHGLDPNVALLVIALVMAALVCILILMMQERIRNLKSIPAEIANTESPIASGVSGVANAFVDGLMGVDKSPVRH